MIHYLYIIGEFWFSSAVKVIEWVSETLFLKNNFLREGNGRRMVLTDKGFQMKSQRSGGFHGEYEELELGLGSVRFTRGLGRKRILISSRVREPLSRSAVEIPAPESPPVKSSLKRQRSLTIAFSSSEKSLLESLPQELLIRVICGVDHEDLKSLTVVSKSLREASLIAKRLHFAYTTPKKTRAFRNSIDLEEISDSSHQVEDIEPPNAPVHYRWNKAKRKEHLSNVFVALFT
uniref:F-box protein SKIP27 n=1 Tax=Noccaea caerulescens TaxID=107243 RepID=A0A1J3CFH7_NOCCA